MSVGQKKIMKAALYITRYGPDKDLGPREIIQILSQSVIFCVADRLSHDALACKLQSSTQDTVQTRISDKEREFITQAASFLFTHTHMLRVSTICHLVISRPAKKSNILAQIL